MKKLIPIFCVLLFTSFAKPALSTKNPEDIPNEAGVTEKTNSPVDLSLQFTAEDGTTAPLSTFALLNRPTIIVPVYYRCPRLCTLTLDNLVKTLRQQDLVLGKDYSILTVSFADDEGPKLAKKRADSFKKAYLDEPGLLKDKLTEKNTAKGWKFLTGSKENIEKLMNQIGFHYKKDGEDFSHSSLLVFLNPEGLVSHYFYGFPVTGDNFKLALIESSEGIIGSAFERILLYCFRFDPTKGQYTLAVLKLTQIIAGISFFGLAGLLLYLRKY